MAANPLSPILTKLRYKPGMRVCIRHAPEAFSAISATLPEAPAIQLRGQFDIVQAFFIEKAALQREAPAIHKALAQGGMAWICYPKAKALATDLNRDIVRETVAPLGLETVAQVAIDDVWSALRCKAT